MNDITLILAAHGSGDDSSANQRIRALAKKIAREHAFGEVLAAFNLGTPSFGSAIDEVTNDRVVIVPVMTSEGYFSQSVLPRELQKSNRYSQVDPVITKSVGMHSVVPEILHELARCGVEQHGLATNRTAVVIVGHGTRKDSRSGVSTIAMCEVLQDRIGCAGVYPAFLDQEPLVEEIPLRLPGHNLVVIPFLIGGGHHVTQDIPHRLSTAEGTDRRIIITPAFGDHPRLAEMILDLANEAATSMRSCVGGLR